MIKTVIHDPILLSQKAVPATRDDIPVADDLQDTLKANADRCVGMAANMIGTAKRIIVFFDGGICITMFNPELLSASEPYETEEGCLSLTGTRKTKRFRTIRVRWQNRHFQWQTKTFSGWTAQIIQHELDHCSGILI